VLVLAAAQHQSASLLLTSQSLLKAADTKIVLNVVISNADQTPERKDDRIVELSVLATTDKATREEANIEKKLYDSIQNTWGPHAVFKVNFASDIDPNGDDGMVVLNRIMTLLLFNNLLFSACHFCFAQKINDKTKKYLDEKFEDKFIFHFISSAFIANQIFPTKAPKPPTGVSLRGNSPDGNFGGNGGGSLDLTPKTARNLSYYFMSLIRRIVFRINELKKLIPTVEKKMLIKWIGFPNNTSSINSSPFIYNTHIILIPLSLQ
jgi:hypothetical protein